INEQYAARAARFLAWTGTPWRVPARELGRSVPSGFIVWITVQLIHSPEGLRPQDTGRTTMSTRTMHSSAARSAIRQEPKRSHGRGRQATAATHAGADPAGAVRWANEVTVSALLDGLAWGVAGMLFLVPDSPALQMLLITMIVGTSAGSVFVTSFWPRSEYAFAIP